MSLKNRIKIPLTGVPKNEAEREKQIDKLTLNSLKKRALWSKPLHAAIETWEKGKSGLMEKSVEDMGKMLLKRRLKAIELLQKRAQRKIIPTKLK